MKNTKQKNKIETITIMGINMISILFAVILLSVLSTRMIMMNQEYLWSKRSDLFDYNKNTIMQSNIQPYTIMSNIINDTKDDIVEASVIHTEPITEDIVEEELPPWSGGGEFKSFEDYNMINDRTSSQYKLQQQAWTNDEGIRCIGDYRMVALGFGHNLVIGDKIKVILTTGNEFLAIVGDYKDNKDTLDDNITHNKDSSIIEFIVDDDLIDDMVMKIGSFSCLDQFAGGVKNIIKIEE